jgi:hypothetical protein
MSTEAEDLRDIARRIDTVLWPLCRSLSAHSLHLPPTFGWRTARAYFRPLAAPPGTASRYPAPRNTDLVAVLRGLYIPEAYTG